MPSNGRNNEENEGSGFIYIGWGAANEDVGL